MSVLATLIKPKILFDADNRKHIERYRDFLRDHKWGFDGCPFILEFPYLTIPDMIKDRMIHKLLKVTK